MKALTFILISFLAFTACAQKKEGVTNITADSLQKAIKDEHVVVLDVRTPEEYNEGHIPGAINVDYLNENFENGVDTLNKELVYEVYCRSGNRSENAAEIMSKKGFKNVFNYDGGYVEWKKLGLPVVK